MEGRVWSLSKAGRARERRTAATRLAQKPELPVQGSNTKAAGPCRTEPSWSAALSGSFQDRVDRLSPRQNDPRQHNYMLPTKLTVEDRTSPLCGTPEALNRWNDCPRVPPPHRREKEMLSATLTRPRRQHSFLCSAANSSFRVPSRGVTNLQSTSSGCATLASGSIGHSVVRRRTTPPTQMGRDWILAERGRVQIYSAVASMAAAPPSFQRGPGLLHSVGQGPSASGGALLPFLKEAGGLRKALLTGWRSPAFLGVC